MRAEMAAVAKQLADSNARNDVLARENVTLKAEVDRLNLQVRDGDQAPAVPAAASCMLRGWDVPPWADEGLDIFSCEHVLCPPRSGTWRLAVASRESAACSASRRRTTS